MSTSIVEPSRNSAHDRTMKQEDILCTGNQHVRRELPYTNQGKLASQYRNPKVRKYKFQIVECLRGDQDVQLLVYSPPFPPFSIKRLTRSGPSRFQSCCWKLSPSHNIAQAAVAEIKKNIVPNKLAVAEKSGFPASSLQ